MDFEDLSEVEQAILLSAFEDEIEKIAGAKRFLRLERAVWRKGSDASPELLAARDRARRKYQRRVTPEGSNPFSAAVDKSQAYMERVGFRPRGDMPVPGRYEMGTLAHRAVRAGPSKG